MSDLFVAAESRPNVAEYTVSEISGALKRTVEDQFGHVRVRGEISGYRGPHSSGHAYFCLKDDRARLDAVVWRTTMARLRFRPEEGMEVVATGKLTTYPGKSTYQLVIDSLEPAGAGALMALLEERKRRLGAEGLFEQARKRPLPYMPRVIGVVTSPTGAVIRDIIHRIADRFPLHVLVWPVRVQGETAGPEVAAAVAGFNSLDGGAIPRPDLVIVARGGGSLEDLWGFNDEAVVRAVAASRIPVISAVGHETDWTLIDLVADMRAPTPTGAAELAVPVRAELEANVAGLSARLSGAVSRGGERRRQHLRAAVRALPSADQLLALPRRRFDEAASRLERALEVATARRRARLDAARLSTATLDRALAAERRHLVTCSDRFQGVLMARLRERRRGFEACARRLTPEPLARRVQRLRQEAGRRTENLDRCFDRLRERQAARFHRAELRLRIEPIQERLARRRQGLEQAARLLSSVSYQSVLERGFALVTDADGTLVRRAEAVGAGERLSIRFADGSVDATAQGEAPHSAARARTAPRQPKQGGGQGSLF